MNNEGIGSSQFSHEQEHTNVLLPDALYEKEQHGLENTIKHSLSLKDALDVIHSVKTDGYVDEVERKFPSYNHNEQPVPSSVHAENIHVIGMMQPRDQMIKKVAKEVAVAGYENIPFMEELFLDQFFQRTRNEIGVNYLIENSLIFEIHKNYAEFISEELLRFYIEKMPETEESFTTRVTLLYKMLFSPEIIKSHMHFIRSMLSSECGGNQFKTNKLKKLVGGNGDFIVAEKEGMFSYELVNISPETFHDGEILGRIAANAYAMIDSGGVLRIQQDPDLIKRIEALMKKVESLEKEMFGLDEANRKALEKRIAQITYEVELLIPSALTEDTLSIPGEHLEGGLLQEYIAFNSRGIREQIRERLGVDFSKLTLREGSYFIMYILRLNSTDALRFSELVRRFDMIFAKTFLTIGNNPTLTEMVMRFSETKSEELVREVFDSYGKIVSRIDDVGDYLRETFGEESTEHANTVIEQLLSRARKVLEDAVSEDEAKRAKLFAQIKELDANIALFTSACKTLQKNGKLHLGDVVGTSISEKSVGALSGDEKGALLDLQDRVYREAYTPEFLAKLRTALELALENPDTHFYFLKKEENGAESLVSTLRFDPPTSERNAKHMASFFTNPSYNGGAIGEALLDEALMREQADGSAIVLECSPHLMEFYSKHGFVEKNRFVFEGQDGVAMEKAPVVGPYTQAAARVEEVAA